MNNHIRICSNQLVEALNNNQTCKNDDAKKMYTYEILLPVMYMLVLFH